MLNEALSVNRTYILLPDSNRCFQHFSLDFVFYTFNSTIYYFWQSQNNSFYLLGTDAFASNFDYLL